MAYQPKSYRKFLAGSVSAAVVASALAAPAGAAAAAASFPDVPTGHWAYNEITTLADKGIINGYSDGSFKPSQLLNRGQAAVLFTNALGLDVPENLNVFKDLKATSYFAQYAAAVEANGVFGGYADGNFGAGDNLTREQMASVLVRAFDFKDTGAAVDLTDLNAAHASHRENIKILTQNGISVNADKTFDPKEPVSRAHFATFLYRSMLATGMLNENPDVVSVTAINATTVEVKMAGEVKDVDSIDFTIDGLTVSNAAVKQTDSSVVVLTTSAQEGGKEYTLKGNGETFGKFTGISAVVPTSIKLVSTSAQSKVGNEVTLRADIGSKTAGVPVTFNVDAPAGSLNKDQVVEVYTNADGIAEYSYTQYAAGIDTVAVYPTGAPQLRDFATVYWGVNDILKLTTDSDVTLANGEEKTYTVKYTDPTTGKPVANAELNVTFLENVNVKPSDVKKAVVGDPSYNTSVTPYQTTDGDEEVAIVETDSNGVATFTVSGTNTAVTPVVFVDSNNNERWDTTEIQTVGNKVTFAGAQENNKFTVAGEDLTVSLGLVSDKDEAAEGNNNGRMYTVSVTNKDGKAYAGGVVNVALQEDIDGNRSTNTTATIGTSAKDPAGNDLLGSVVAGPANSDAEVQLTLDKDGKAEFFVFGSDNQVATPVVWIDQNDAQNNQTGYLEDGEPRMVAATTSFQTARVTGATLDINGEEDTAVSLDGDDTAEINFTPVNQSGNFYDVDYDVTYVVTNTGTNPVQILTAGYEDGKGNAIPVGTEIKVGGSLTLHDNNATGVNTLEISGDNTSVSVRATGVTEDYISGGVSGVVTGTGDKREDNLRLVPKQVVTATFGVAGELKSGLTYDGTVVSVDADKDKVVLEINGEEYTLTYTGDKLFIGGQSTSPNAFETALSVGDSVAYIKGDVESFDITEDVSLVEALQADIDGTNELVEGNYSPSSWTALQNALTAARTVVADEDASAAELNKAISDLEDAVEGLEEGTEPTVLSAVTSSANSVVLTFSEVVDEDTAEAVANYELVTAEQDDNSTVTSATLATDGKTLTIFAAGAEIAAADTIRVSNVEDAVGNKIVTVTTPITSAN